MPEQKQRGAFLTVVAVLFAVLAVSNTTKALQFLMNPSHLGIVIFGVRFESVLANVLLGPSSARSSRPTPTDCGRSSRGSHRSPSSTRSTSR